MNSFPAVEGLDRVSEGTREEIRRRYLAALAASDRGGPAPDLDSFLAACPRDTRDELRSDLHALGESYRQGRAEVDARQAPTVQSPSPAAPTIASDSQTIGMGMSAGPDDQESSLQVSEADTKLVEDAQPREAEPIPETVAGYDVLGVLGRGAMGVVYKARQRGLKRIVALKMILAAGHAGEHELARFRMEAEAVAQLQHPNIVQIYEVGQDGGQPFFSLELVDGPSLDKKIQDSPLPPREAARLTQLLASAMEYAHGRRIIHRDLKPANVLLTADGTPKIGDFGLAKRIDDDSGRTRTGTVLGTPAYMSPEQAEGRLSEVGPLSDVYALGAVLYDMLTGRAPFKGTTILETLEQVRTREPVPPMLLQPGVPRDLETICLKCLHKDPARRYASAGALAQDLDRFLKGEPILARPIGRVERLWRSCRRNPWIAGLSAAIALLLVGWAVTSSALALSLNAQKDLAEANGENARQNEEAAKKNAGIAQRNMAEAVKQTGIAKRSMAEAVKQEGIAKRNMAEAVKQAGIAKQNTAEAVKQEGLAKRNAAEAVKQTAIAKQTATATVTEIVRLGQVLQTRLKDKRFSFHGTPEVRRLREDVLALLRQSLTQVARQVDGAGATSFGAVATCQALGDLLAGLGQGQEALRVYQQGYDLCKKVADAKPDSDLARGNLGVMLMRLGDIALEVNGNARAAERYFTQSRSLRQEILNHPRDKSFKELVVKLMVAHDDIRLGRALLALGKPAEASKLFDEALSYRQGWVAAEPKSGNARSYLMQAHLYMGIAAAHRADAEALRKHFGAALRLGDELQVPEALIKQNPIATAARREDLALTQGAYGDALLQVGETAAAAKAYGSSLKNLELAIAQDPDSLARQSLLALTYERLAAISIRQGQLAEAGKQYSKALKVRMELVQLDTNSLSRLADYLLALAHAGQSDEAAALATKLRPRVSESTKLLLQLARCYAVCASRDKAKRATYTEKALKALRAATKEGYKDTVVLETDADLASLRGEAGFAEVLKRVMATSRR